MAGLADLFEFFLCKKFDPLGHFAPKKKKTEGKWPKFQQFSEFWLKLGPQFGRPCPMQWIPKKRAEK
jgi:hypothetical protein